MNERRNISTRPTQQYGFGLFEKAIKSLLVFLAQPHSKLLSPSMFCFLGESEGFHTHYLGEFLRSKSRGDQNHLCNSTNTFCSIGNGTNYKLLKIYAAPNIFIFWVLIIKFRENNLWCCKMFSKYGLFLQEVPI